VKDIDRITKTRKKKSTKRGVRVPKHEMDELNLQAILNDDRSHPFEGLSRKIIGAASKESLTELAFFRVFSISCFRDLNLSF
jgi:hypothetical protein